MKTLYLRDYIPKSRSVAFDGEKATAAKTVNEAAAANWGDPKWHREQAAVIGEVIDEKFDRGPNPFAGVINTVTVGYADVKTIKLRRGLQVFGVATGGYVDESTLQTDIYTMGRDSFGWHIVATEEDALSDWAETTASIRQLATMKEEQEILRRQYALLDEAVTSSSAYFVDGTGGLTKPMLDDAINAVFDAPRYEVPLALNSQIQIIGRASAVDQIADLPNFTPSENALDEIRATGFLGTYKGARVVRLQNFTDEDGTSYFPEDELWVVSPGAGQFVLYGGTRPNGWVEPALRKAHMDSRRTVGGAVYQPQVVRRIGNLDD